MKKGRPAQFRNAAEKQKAYRQRKKQADAALEALRKSEYENSLECLRANELNLHKACDNWLHGSPYHTNGFLRGEDNYNAWAAEYRRLCDSWWEAHRKWYSKWKTLGFPPEGKIEWR
jgi:hypothetical protein